MEVSEEPAASDAPDPTPSPADSAAPTDSERTQPDRECVGDQGGKAAKKRRLSGDGCDQQSDDESACCPICLCEWTTTGDHRLCALKCGHLFGFKCVTRWMETKKNCPTCKKKVNTRDIRYIYARKLVAADTAEAESLRKELELTVEEKNRLSHNLAKCRAEVVALQQELTLSRKNQHGGRDAPFSVAQPTSRYSAGARLYMHKSLEVCKRAGCRVLDINAQHDLLVASMRSPNDLFSGYGLRKIHVASHKPLSFVPLHAQPIRDVRFHPHGGCVLSVGMDKAANVVDVTSNRTASTVRCDAPLWSCCWDADDANVYYCGTQAGAVLRFDRRQGRAPLEALAVPGDMSPVVSVVSVSRRSSGRQHALAGAVISCKLNSLWLFEGPQNRHSLPLEGPFTSMRYQSDAEQLLVSSRPNGRSPYSWHTVCQLRRAEEGEVRCDTLHSFRGGGMQKLLCKSSFVSNVGDYVAAYQESDRCVHLWSLNTGQREASVPAGEVVMDLGAVANDSGNYLVSLTERKLEFFKFH